MYIAQIAMHFSPDISEPEDSNNITSLDLLSIQQCGLLLLVCNLPFFHRNSVQKYCNNIYKTSLTYGLWEYDYEYDLLTMTMYAPYLCHCSVIDILFKIFKETI